MELIGNYGKLCYNYSRSNTMKQAYLKELVIYDSTTGNFYNRKTKRRIGFIHDPMGKNKTKYIKIQLKGKRYYAHRLAWLYVYGEMPKHTIDHIDHNGLNNSIDNLRDVLHSENLKNVRKLKSNTSGYTGVWKQKNRWISEIRIKGKKISLGSFVNIQDAVIARMNAEKKYGFHANHGK